MKKKYTFFKKRLERLPALVTVLICLLLAHHSTHAQTPSIGSFNNISYLERADAEPVAPSITVANGESYADSWIEFEISSPATSETLGFITASEPVITDGAVSIVGTDIYRGNGSGADQIGTVDATHNGQNGSKLRFNFSAPLANAQFTEGSGTDIPGWTVNNSQIYPGTEAGHVALFPRTQGRAVTKTGSSAPYTIIRYEDQASPGQTSGTIEYQFQTDYNYDFATRDAWGHEGESLRGLISSSSSGIPGVGSTFTTTIVEDLDATGNTALRLYSWGWLTSLATPTGANPAGTCRKDCTPMNKYGSAFGPEVWSEPFDAQAGDQLALDWRATGSNDDYEVYAYVVNTSNDEHTLLFYGRGASQPWTTATGTIPTTGNFRFRFINGSYDRTGGYLLGADFFIDNIRVLSSVSAVDDDVEQLARLTTYHNSSCTPDPTRTLTFRARSQTGEIGSEEATINITLAPAPISGSLTKNPDIDTVDMGSVVSATLSPGIHGDGTDELQYRTHNGTKWSNWQNYTSGAPISSFKKTEIEVRTRRLDDNCPPANFELVRWDVLQTTVKNEDKEFVYYEIQDAVGAASPSNTICIGTNTYDETVDTSTKGGLILRAGCNGDVGIVTVTGGFTLTPDDELKLELSGDNDYDKFIIGGNAQINGASLDIKVASGYEPAAGTRFIIFTSPNPPGEFSNPTLVKTNGHQFILSYEHDVDNGTWNVVLTSLAPLLKLEIHHIESRP